MHLTGSMASSAVASSSGCHLGRPGGGSLEAWKGAKPSQTAAGPRYGVLVGGVAAGEVGQA